MPPSWGLLSNAQLFKEVESRAILVPTAAEVGGGLVCSGNSQWFGGAGGPDSKAGHVGEEKLSSG